MRDIVTSYLPHWTDTRAWIIARPLTGFAETFSQYIIEVFPGRRQHQARARSRRRGRAVRRRRPGQPHHRGQGPHAARPAATPTCPPAANGSCSTRRKAPVRFHWIRKPYEAVDGIDVPDSLRRQRAGRADRLDARHQQTLGHHALRRSRRPARTTCTSTSSRSSPAPSSRSRKPTSWSTASTCSRARPSIASTSDWHEVEAGDFMWLRAFCPQACYAGPERFRYLLYKDVNRHAKLKL